VTLSKNLKDFPPTYISTCGKDPLRDDGKVLELMLKKEGVPVKRDHYDGVPHYFWMFPGVEEDLNFLENVAKGAQWALNH
jgi:versiconal hemiacetal acetate esterase